MVFCNYHRWDFIIYTLLWQKVADQNRYDIFKLRTKISVYLHLFVFRRWHVCIFSQLFQACTQLDSLDLDYCSRLSSSPECEVLWTLPQSLVSLSLCGLMLQDGQILVECITRLPHVANLKLCGVPGLNDGTLAQVSWEFFICIALLIFFSSKGS